jgi:hypothetical protein
VNDARHAGERRVRRIADQEGSAEHRGSLSSSARPEWPAGRRLCKRRGRHRTDPGTG